MLVNERLLPTLSPIYPQIWEGVCIFGDSPVPHFDNAKIWNPVMTGVCQVMTGVCQGGRRHGKNPNNETTVRGSAHFDQNAHLGRTLCTQNAHLGTDLITRKDDISHMRDIVLLLMQIIQN